MLQNCVPDKHTQVNSTHHHWCLTGSEAGLTLDKQGELGTRWDLLVITWRYNPAVSLPVKRLLRTEASIGHEAEPPAVENCFEATCEGRAHPAFSDCKRWHALCYMRISGPF